MAAWAGLGYYSRARNLHRCAQTVVERYEGRFPATVDALAELPGIGRSTAAAIAAFAFGERAAILDGNVKRVFARHFGVEGYPGATAVERQLWSIAEQELPASGIEGYTQGLMDLGATLCVRARPRCGDCPVAVTCVARAQGRTEELPAAAARKGTAGAPRDRRDRARRPRSVVAGDPSPDRHLGRAREPSRVRCRGGRRAIAVGDRRAIRAAGRSERTLPELRHEFSHYSLVMHPRVAAVRRALGAATAASQWLGPDALQDAALPAPVKRLLRAQYGKG